MKNKRIIKTETRFPDPLPGPYKTVAEMTELCCEETGAVQCRELVTDRQWPGYSTEEVLEELGIELDGQGFDQEGRRVVIRFKARTRPCGKAVTRYRFEQKNCCEEVAPLVYDNTSSVSVLAPETDGVVYAVGGKSPYIWRVRGNGFSFDGYNDRNVQTELPWVRVYAHESACGTAPITVTDGCTTAAGAVRSTEGRWVGDCYAYSLSDWGTTYRQGYVDQAVMTNPCVADRVAGWASSPVLVYNYIFYTSYKWDGANWIMQSNFGGGRYIRVGGPFDAHRAMIMSYGFGNAHPITYWPDGPPAEGAMCGDCQWVC